MVKKKLRNVKNKCKNVKDFSKNQCLRRTNEILRLLPMAVYAKRKTFVKKKGPKDLFNLSDKAAASSKN